MPYFGNSDLKLRYCGILKTCGIRFLAFWSVLKIILPLFSTLFDLFQVSCRFGNSCRNASKQFLGSLIRHACLYIGHVTRNVITI